MPAGDGTGPQGMGAMTGRAAGYCAGSDAPGYANPGPRYGAGTGIGRGCGAGRRGRRNLFPATGRGADPGETQMLRRRAEALQSEVDRIRKRLEDLENTASPE